jgi:hypothetical protein
MDPYLPPKTDCLACPEPPLRVGLRPLEALILVGIVAWLAALLRPILWLAIHGG